MSSCPDCGQEFDPIIGPFVDPLVDPFIDHCHGTLIVHSDRTLECTDAACQLPELLRHDLIIDCAVVLGGCCRVDDASGLQAAS
jgi:hypothetical protein